MSAEPTVVGARSRADADRRLLPGRGAGGPMPLVIAVMLLLMTLAAAGGLALHDATGRLGRDVADRVTIQIVEADAAVRDEAARRVLAALGGRPDVSAVRQVGADEMTRLLEPWLGGAISGDLALPAMIDATLAPGTDRAAFAAMLRSISPSAVIDEHGAALAPLTRLLGDLEWLAVGLVVLTALATGMTVVLAARGALDTHRPTIDVMHLLGATDVQVARLFQRRIARDALIGALAGWGLALIVLALVGERAAALESELIGAGALDWIDWLLLAVLPLAAAGLAMATARAAVLAALRGSP